MTTDKVHRLSLESRVGNCMCFSQFRTIWIAMNILIHVPTQDLCNILILTDNIQQKISNKLSWFQVFMARHAGSQGIASNVVSHNTVEGNTFFRKDVSLMCMYLYFILLPYRVSCFYIGSDDCHWAAPCSLFQPDDVIIHHNWFLCMCESSYHDWLYITTKPYNIPQTLNSKLLCWGFP